MTGGGKFIRSFGFAAVWLTFAATTPGLAQAEGGVDQSAPLYEKLPQAIKDKGYIVSATTGRYPPYNFLKEDGKTLQGAAIDLGEEMGKVLGVPVRNEIAESVASFITGVISGRYDFVFGTVADTAERQNTVDMIDWTSQTTAFLVRKGNPKNINGIGDICGLRVAVQQASFAEPVLHQQDDICKKNERKPVDVQTLSDQATMALAIQAGRIDASFAGNAALVFYQSKNAQFEVVGAGENLMGTLWQASVTPKGSELTPVILAAWEELYKSGAYQRIMTKWGVDKDMLKAPGINMAK